MSLSGRSLHLTCTEYMKRLATSHPTFPVAPVIALDWDYSMTMISPSGRGGIELAVAQDLFVHHFGSRIFTGNGVDTNRLLDKNATKFAAKWGNAVPQKLRVTLRPFSPRPQTHQEGAIDPQMSQRSVCSVVKSSSEPMLGTFVRSWIIRVHLCASVARQFRSPVMAIQQPLQLRPLMRVASILWLNPI